MAGGSKKNGSKDKDKERNRRRSAVAPEKNTAPREGGVQGADASAQVRGEGDTDRQAPPSVVHTSAGSSTTSSPTAEEVQGVKDFRASQVVSKVVSCPKQDALIVRNVVRNMLFRAFKFVHEDDLCYNGPVAKYVMSQIGREFSEVGYRDFWRTHRDTVRKAIDSKRSTTAMAVKKVVISKYYRYLCVLFKK